MVSLAEPQKRSISERIGRFIGACITMSVAVFTLTFLLGGSILFGYRFAEFVVSLVIK